MGLFSGDYGTLLIQLSLPHSLCYQGPRQGRRLCPDAQEGGASHGHRGEGPCHLRAFRRPHGHLPAYHQTEDDRTYPDGMYVTYICVCSVGVWLSTVAKGPPIPVAAWLWRLVMSLGPSTGAVSG